MFLCYFCSLYFIIISFWYYSVHVLHFEMITGMLYCNKRVSFPCGCFSFCVYCVPMWLIKVYYCSAYVPMILRSIITPWIDRMPLLLCSNMTASLDDSVDAVQFFIIIYQCNIYYIWLHAGTACFNKHVPIPRRRVSVAWVFNIL